MIGNITIAIADAFSLEMKGEGTLQSLSPILYPSRGQSEQPLLPPEQQQAFVHRFYGASTVNSVYSIGNQVFVVIEPPLRRALAEVRRANGGSTATKRAFMANPRAFLRDALGDDADEVVLEGLFRETSSYSDRVIGLGLWKPRVVPWIKLPPTDWFNSGSESNGGFGRREPADKAKFGIQVGDKRLELSKKDVQDLISSIYACKVEGAPSVNFSSGGEEVAVPATDETLAALQKLLASGADPPKKAEEGTPKKDKPESLIISANEAELEIEGEFVAKRDGPPVRPP